MWFNSGSGSGRPSIGSQRLQYCLQIATTAIFCEVCDEVEGINCQLPEEAAEHQSAVDSTTAVNCHKWHCKRVQCQLFIDCLSQMQNGRKSIRVVSKTRGVRGRTVRNSNNNVVHVIQYPITMTTPKLLRIKRLDGKILLQNMLVLT